MVDKVFSFLTGFIVLAAVAVTFKKGSQAPQTVGALFTGEGDVIKAAEDN